MEVIEVILRTIGLAIDIAIIVVIFQTHALATKIQSKLFEMEWREKEREKRNEEKNK